MACFHPVKAFQAEKGGPLVFKCASPSHYPVTVPCGTCSGCLLERSRQWAIRCMHEASLYEENAFVTLTYEEEWLPPGGTLVKKHFQDFMKRLRRRFDGQRIRYYHCGEYGDLYRRPHYHACLFGFDFPDKVVWTVRKGRTVWRSPVLERLWPFGQSEIGTVTFESAAYVARYVMKKQFGKNAWLSYQDVDLETGELGEPREPEYTTMSRRPGIGKPWLDKFMCEVYPADSVVVRGRLVKPPRYYDLQFELVDPLQALDVARKRRRARRWKEETRERLAVREICTDARIARMERSLEQ